MALNFGPGGVTKPTDYTIECRAMASNIPYHAKKLITAHERYGHFTLLITASSDGVLMRRPYVVSFALSQGKVN